jgi:hypothetical protein
MAASTVHPEGKLTSKTDAAGAYLPSSACLPQKSLTPILSTKKKTNKIPKIPVLWAQRSSKSDPERNIVYLTIAAPDIPQKDLKLDLQATKIVFSGKSTTKNVTYAGDFEFYEEIDVKDSKTNHTDRDIELVLRKKEAKEEFWPRLLKEKAKVHWLKTDFDKVGFLLCFFAFASC